MYNVFCTCTLFMYILQHKTLCLCTYEIKSSMLWSFIFTENGARFMQIAIQLVLTEATESIFVSRSARAPSSSWTHVIGGEGEAGAGLGRLCPTIKDRPQGTVLKDSWWWERWTYLCHDGCEQACCKDKPFRFKTNSNVAKRKTEKCNFYYVRVCK